MAETMRLITAYLDYMRLRNLAETTVRVNRDALLRLARWLDPVPLIQATAEDIHRWAVTLERLQPRTRYAELSRVHCFYKWCRDMAFIDEIPTRQIPRPKVPRSVPRPISEALLAVALSGAADDVYCYLILGAFAGLRCAEMAALARADVLDHADPPVIIVNGKGSKERVVPMHPAVLDALRRYGLPQSGWVFRRRDGQHGRPSAGAVSLIVNRWLRANGITETAHQTRHRAITNVYRACPDIRVAQTFAGHSSPQTTAGYAAHSPDRLLSAVLSIAAPSVA